MPAGSELDWKGFGPPPGKAAPPPFEAIFKWGLGADWDWRTFDFDRNYTTLVAKLGPLVDALNPDLSAFASHGHKLIVYHGWADSLVTPGEAINYRDAVLADHRHRVGSASGADTERETNQFYRLFMIPGMAHLRRRSGALRVQSNGLPCEMGRRGDCPGLDCGPWETRRS